MHQYPGLPQISPTAARCNCKHPQSPDQRRLPALPKSTDSPQPKSFVSPMTLFDASLCAVYPTLSLLLLASSLSNSRHMASHIMLRLLSKTYTMHRPRLQLPRLCRPQVFTALLKSTISLLPKTTVPSEKMTVFFFSPLPVPVFSESTGWEEHRKPHITSVCMKITLFVL